MAKPPHASQMLRSMRIHTTAPHGSNGALALRSEGEGLTDKAHRQGGLGDHIQEDLRNRFKNPQGLRGRQIWVLGEGFAVETPGALRTENGRTWKKGGLGERETAAVSATGPWL